MIQMEPGNLSRWSLEGDLAAGVQQGYGWYLWCCLPWGNIKNKLTVSQSANAGRLLEFPRRANGTPSPQSMMAKKKPSAMLEEMIHWTITILSSSHFKMFACCIGGLKSLLSSSCFVFKLFSPWDARCLSWSCKDWPTEALVDASGLFWTLVEGRGVVRWWKNVVASFWVHFYDDNTNMMSSGCEKISHGDASDQED